MEISISEFDETVIDDAKYREFEDALAAVLEETDYNIMRRSRLAAARAAVNHRDCRYVEAINRAFDRMGAPR